MMLCMKKCNFFPVKQGQITNTPLEGGFNEDDVLRKFHNIVSIWET